MSNTSSRRRGRAIRRARRNGNLNQYLALTRAWNDARNEIRRVWGVIRAAVAPALKTLMQTIPQQPKRQILHNGKKPRR